MLISGIVLTSLGLGFLMSLFGETSMLHNPNPYLDAFALLTVIAGFVLIINNYKQGFLMLYLSNIVLIILFVVLAQWASMIMILVFVLTTDLVGVLH
ncbi:MAG: hypothetical protein DRP42_00065 [Tenericutes bacterium]|nr:MAG: hypothetical protein DRP42_00065 [Mycoplasmatota bacterium]